MLETTPLRFPNLDRREYGLVPVRVDRSAELEKLLEETGRDIVVQVRIAVPTPSATISFSSKFGATAEEGAKLLRAVAERGATPAVSTHLGYQTTDPRAFAEGLRVLEMMGAYSNALITDFNGLGAHEYAVIDE